MSDCSDIDLVVAKNNELRTKHQAPNTAWDEGLAGGAQTWAKGLAAAGCGLTHSTNRGDVGENL